MHLVLGGGWNYNLRQVISVSVVAYLAPAFVRLMRDEGKIDQRRPVQETLESQQVISEYCWCQCQGYVVDWLSLLQV